MLVDLSDPAVLALCNESERILLANLSHRIAAIARSKAQGDARPSPTPIRYPTHR